MLIFKEKTPVLTFDEAVRKRPIMFIGNNGVTELLKNVVIDCITITGTD